MSEENGSGQGLKSLDTALALLGYMATQPGPQSLSEIGRASGMPPSKAHRYLASFVAAGLVQQQGRSGRYDLGPQALRLGLAALARQNFVNAAADGLSDLSAETGMTVLLSVWANQGATVVRWERGVAPTDTSVGLGSTLPLLNSATGRVFLAWGPTQAVAPVRDAQLRQLTKQRSLSLDMEPTQAGVADLIERTRARGFASVEGRFIPGLVAAAAPVLDWQDEAQAAITLVGIDAADIEPGSPQTDRLLDYCASKSITGVSA
ncbi:MAG: IclR family transcriptional regulator [Pseudomonadota bacterium]